MENCDELYNQLLELEKEYSYTKNIATKQEMVAICTELNLALTNQLNGHTR